MPLRSPDFGLPVGNAAVFQHWLGQRLARRFRVIMPLLFTRTRIQRNQAIEWRANVERIVGENGRCGPDGSWRIAFTIRDVAGMEFPDFR